MNIGKAVELPTTKIKTVLGPVSLRTINGKEGKRHLAISGHGFEAMLFNIRPDWPADGEATGVEVHCESELRQGNIRLQALKSIHQDGKQIWPASQK